MAYTERYVTSAGAGLQDGTSEANAWSWADMLTNLAAGQRANVKGNVTTASVTQVWSNLGTATDAIAIRGYSSTIGDLDGSRTGGGALAGTFPIITNAVSGASNGFTLPAHSEISNIHFKTSDSTAYCVGTSGDQGVVRECVIETTDTIGELYDDNGNYFTIVNCDLINNSTGGSFGIRISRSVLSSCRITNPGGTSSAAINMAGTNAAVVGCQILDYAIAISSSSLNFGYVGNCSARNCNTFLNLATAVPAVLVKDCVAWGTNAAGSEFFNGTSTHTIGLYGNAYGNFADSNSGVGHMEEIGKVALTADPFTSSSDLSLNSTAGGGAACLDVGVFGNDLGAIHTHPSTSSFMATRGFSGGFNQ